MCGALQTFISQSKAIILAESIIMITMTMIVALFWVMNLINGSYYNISQSTWLSTVPENLALGKPSLQSSTAHDASNQGSNWRSYLSSSKPVGQNGATVTGESSLAVDGNKTSSAPATLTYEGATVSGTGLK